MKKSKLLKLCSIAFALSLGVGVYALNGAEPLSGIAEEQTPSCEIVGKTLSLKDNIYIRYAVDFQNVLETDERGLLVWNAPQETYEYSTANTVLGSSGTITNESTGIAYPAYAYNELSAKQMTETVYATPYVERNGEYYYGEVEKYSILQYAYKMLGYMESEASTEDGLADLLNAMLSYGAAAQTYHKYNTDKLATDDFTYVRIENAYFEDGFDYGLFEVGDEVEFTLKDGYEFGEALPDNITKTETGYCLTVPSVESKNLVLFTLDARTTKYSQGFEYFISNDRNTYELWNIGDCTDTDIIIPNVYKGKPVTRIASQAFYQNKNITSVTIPDSVTIIDSHAFSYCENLTKVIFGENSDLSRIGDSAFGGCTKLTDIELPNSVSFIGDTAFARCESLTEIIIPDSIGKIVDGAFLYCTSLKSVVIGSSVDYIGTQTFIGCDSLTSVTFKNPNGWSFTSDLSVSGTGISATDLANTETAARYLKSTYYTYYWKRTVTE